MKYGAFLFFAFIIFHSFDVFGQKANNSVKSLVEADESLNYQIFKNGIPNAFLKYADASALVFQPKPESLQSVYKKTKHKDASESLEWKPEYAHISKKGDLGFTSGRFELNEVGKTKYGFYLNVWKNSNGKWKLFYHAKTFQPQQIDETKFDYFDPKNHEFYKLIGPQKIQMRDDIVFGTDELFGKRLASKNGNRYLSEFYDSAVRLYFPSKHPTYTLEESLKFVVRNKMVFQQSVPKGVLRAFSGDLAFTYGEATVANKKYEYLRAWSLDENSSKWNVIIDMYME